MVGQTKSSDRPTIPPGEQNQVETGPVGPPRVMPPPHGRGLQTEQSTPTRIPPLLHRRDNLLGHLLQLVKNTFTRVTQHRPATPHRVVALPPVSDERLLRLPVRGDPVTEVTVDVDGQVPVVVTDPRILPQLDSLPLQCPRQLALRLTVRAYRRPGEQAPHPDQPAAGGSQVLVQPLGTLPGAVLLFQESHDLLLRLHAPSEQRIPGGDDPGDHRQNLDPP